MEIFQHVDVKTYNRKDVAGQRIGFVAQDIQQYLPPEFANVLGMQYGGDMPLLSLSYDRLVCVLWAVCKSQEQRISALDGRLTSLEAKKQKIRNYETQQKSYRAPTTEAQGFPST